MLRSGISRYKRSAWWRCHQNFYHFPRRLNRSLQFLFSFQVSEWQSMSRGNDDEIRGWWPNSMPTSAKEGELKRNQRLLMASSVGWPSVCKLLVPVRKDWKRITINPPWLKPPKRNDSAFHLDRNASRGSKISPVTWTTELVNHDLHVSSLRRRRSRGSGRKRKNCWCLIPFRARISCWTVSVWKSWRVPSSSGRRSWAIRCGRKWRWREGVPPSRSGSTDPQRSDTL